MPSKHKAARINQKYDLSYYTLQVATWVVAGLQCLNSAGQASLKLCATHRIFVHRTVHFISFHVRGATDMYPGEQTLHRADTFRLPSSVQFALSMAF